MNEKERMLLGLPYRAGIGSLGDESLQCMTKIFRYNLIEPYRVEDRALFLREILGSAGKNIRVESPFHCNYGWNIEVGDNFYSNFNCIMLDVGKITIGSNVMLGPNVAIYTAGHPLHPVSRNSGYECGIGVTIGDNVWIGGSTVINPGIHIGNNVVIGSGSVVTKDIPNNMLAVGNPCRVLREITEDDRDYYYKDRKFDVDDYK